MQVRRGGCVTTTLLLLLLLSGSEACGPGRGSGRRRRPRKLTPLVFKQHVPNVSENTLGASGLTDGRIRRGDPKFKDLVRNNNPDILFKDEEGTGADRIMSQRCKDKLNILAISVLNQWPGVKLRVTEAWDEDNMHAENSLHYEGRAVDITTSDRDRSKYGMLARLAVEAGFDWVYYETRGHIHCSVKSDSSVAIKIGGCFSSTSLVTTQQGSTVSMAELRIGDKVLTMDSEGRLDHADVIAFLDRSPGQMALFYTLTTESGRRVTLTAKHLIHVVSTKSTDVSRSSTSSNTTDDVGFGPFEWHSSKQLAYPTAVTFAEDVQIGQYLLLAQEYEGDVSSHKALPHREELSAQREQQASFSTNIEDFSPGKGDLHWYTRPEKVVAVETRSLPGVYAPLTSQGTIVVDGVVASCYAFILDTRLAHGSLAPLRGYHVIKTFIADWHDYLRWHADWPVSSSLLSQSPQTANVTMVAQDEGAHWYARLLYSIAVNVIGMDITISL